MSIFASILRMAYKLSGAKKAFALPDFEEADFAKIVEILEK